jgi:hypothetical protein
MRGYWQAGIKVPVFTFRAQKTIKVLKNFLALKVEKVKKIGEYPNRRFDILLDLAVKFLLC